MVPAGITGRAASCTSTTSGACGASASSPARTLSWRVAPPGTGGRCGRPSSAGDSIARRRRRPAAADRRAAARRLGGVADHRLAGERQKLLRRLGAEPAAGAGRHQDGCDSHAATLPRPMAASTGSWQAVAIARKSSKTLAASCAAGFALRIGMRVANLPKSMGKCHCDTTVPAAIAAADRPGRWRADRHAGHPGADVGRHRSAVPPARQAARRRHGGLAR